MKELYIANLVKKKKVMPDVYICEVIGPIVGLLLGTHFLSSHSKKYVPMITKFQFLDGNQFYQDIDFSKEPFFSSDEEYAYYNLKKVENYDRLEKIIEDYKKEYSHICYFVDCTTKVPVFIRYKKKR